MMGRNVSAASLNIKHRPTVKTMINVCFLRLRNSSFVVYVTYNNKLICVFVCFMVRLTGRSLLAC